MSDSPDTDDDLRQGVVSWWVMRIGLPIAVLGLISMFLFVPMTPGIVAGQPVTVMGSVAFAVLIVWVCMVLLGLLVGLGWGTLTVWERVYSPWQTRSEQARYRAMSGEEPSLPEWADDDVPVDEDAP